MVSSLNEARLRNLVLHRLHLFSCLCHVPESTSLESRDLQALSSSLAADAYT